MLAHCKSNELNDEVMNILKNVDAGSKIYIDVKAGRSNTKRKKFCLSSNRIIKSVSQ